MNGRITGNHPPHRCFSLNSRDLAVNCNHTHGMYREARAQATRTPGHVNGEFRSHVNRSHQAHPEWTQSRLIHQAQTDAGRHRTGSSDGAGEGTPSGDGLSRLHRNHQPWQDLLQPSRYLKRSLDRQATFRRSRKEQPPGLKHAYIPRAGKTETSECAPYWPWRPKWV
jgi:hypothetical protein